MKLKAVFTQIGLVAAALISSNFISTLSEAALTVVNVDGNTIDSSPYLSDIHYPEPGAAEAMLLANKAQFDQSKPQSVESMLYPAKSSLTPGKLVSHPLATPHLTRPIFVMGDDKFSIEWAKEHAAQLKQMGAIGIITNVGSGSRTIKIEREIGLTLIPASLEGIEKYVQVTHYPFLWTSKDIEQ